MRGFTLRKTKMQEQSLEEVKLDKRKGLVSICKKILKDKKEKKLEKEVKKEEGKK